MSIYPFFTRNGVHNVFVFCLFFLPNTQSIGKIDLAFQSKEDRSISFIKAQSTLNIDNPIQSAWELQLLNSQNKPPLFPTNVTKTEIFFQKNLSDDTNGLGSFTFEAVDNSSIKVSYKFERKTLINPYEVNFSYFILKNEDESYSMDMAGALAPMEMRIGDEVEINYTGDKIHYPKELIIGQTLPDAQGIFELMIPETNIIKNKLSVSNRKVLREEIVDIGGEMHTAMVLFFEVESTKTLGDLLIMESKETVEEWLVPGLGIVNQVRSKKVHNCTRNCEKNGLDNHPLEEEYLVVKSIRITP